MASGMKDKSWGDGKNGEGARSEIGELSRSPFTHLCFVNDISQVILRT